MYGNAVFRPEPAWELLEGQRGLTQRMVIFGKTAMAVGLAFFTLATGMPQTSDTRNVCCPPHEVPLSAWQMKARLRHTVPVLPPPLGKDVRLKGIVVFVVGLDGRGDVVCIRLMSGHPLLAATALDSVKHWNFRADGNRLCGPLVLSLSTLNRDMGLQILDSEPAAH